MEPFHIIISGVLSSLSELQQKLISLLPFYNSPCLCFIIIINNNNFIASIAHDT